MNIGITKFGRNKVLKERNGWIKLDLQPNPDSKTRILRNEMTMCNIPNTKADNKNSFLCIFCERWLNEPVQTSCGCRMCEQCFDNWVGSGNRRCPSEECDGFEMTKKIPDPAIKREMKMITVNCLNKECGALVPLSEFYTHVENCEYSWVDCSMCFGRILSLNKREHEEKNCANRMVECPSCSMYMTNIEFERIHYDLCQWYMSRSQLTEETPLGFSSEVLSDNMGDKRLHQDVEDYSMNRFINELQGRLQKMEQLKEVVMNESFKRTTLQQDIENNLDEMKSEIVILKNRLIHTIPEEDTGLVTSEFVWKIKEFRGLYSESKSGNSRFHCSKLFYTKEVGYKLFLKIYPHGDSDALGTHLSVFMAIAKGKYDPILTWPFPYRFTIKLLNQNGGKDHTERFKPDWRSICFDRPADLVNPATGNPSFITLKSLFANDDYLKNDVMFIKCEIHE